MPDLIPPATTTPVPPTSTVTTSELARFDLSAVMEAGRGTWPLAAQLDPKTFQLLRDMTDRGYEI